MASPGIVGFRRQNMAFSLAGALLLAGLLALLLMTGGIPTARAAGPVLTVSTGTTNPGGDVVVSGTGWAPAKHYNLYVYGQAKCKPNPTCPPPATAKPINSSPQPIRSNGSFGGFDFTFISTAAATTYVFTVVADYPTDNPYTASVLVKVVPAGTPPAGTPVSSSLTSTPTSAATTVTASATTTSQTGTGPGTQTTTPTNSSGGNTLAIIVVVVLLLIAIAVLIGLLIVLPPKRRAIRAAWYGAGSGGTGGRRYGASGPAGPGPRRTTGGYPPMGGQEPPARMGGVAQWDEPPRGSGPRPRSPRRPPGSGY
ncbi:MAG TPA: hypothetical protein VFU69_19735 [Ktedonobacterales bacterium]|nr:hypothetical protein [Ktedonobacterales bacterium]